MEIKQGAIFWVEDDAPEGSEPGYTRPYVVIQNDFYNTSKLRTVLVCGLTTNLRRAESSENVLLNYGEANLSKQSVVVVSQFLTLDKETLGEYIGTLSSARVAQILRGLHLLTHPRLPEEKPDTL